jgi:hypothetical protein
MTAALVMKGYAPQVSGGVAEDDAMAKILAAIKRAPKGPPLSDEERDRVADNRARGYPTVSGDELRAQIAALPDE